jgi:hypothetical protein
MSFTPVSILYSHFLTFLLFLPEDADSRFLQNVGMFLSGSNLLWFRSCKGKTNLNSYVIDGMFGFRNKSAKVYSWTSMQRMTVYIILQMHSFWFCVFHWLLSSFMQTDWYLAQLTAIEITLPNQKRLLLIFYSNFIQIGKYSILQ